MGGCRREPPLVPLPPPIEKKSFKTQLVEGSWRTVVSTAGVALDEVTQKLADGFTQIVRKPLTGRVSQNSLRFENSGKVVMIYGIELSPVNDPADMLEFVYTFKGSYWISEDSGSSATTTLSFTEDALNIKPENEALYLIKTDYEEKSNPPGDVITDERVSINENQLRLGRLVAESVN